MDRYIPLPPLPQRISRLNELAYDLWWSWNPRAREVFRTLDYPLWRFTDHNPVLVLHLVEAERLEFAAEDPEFLSLYDDAIAALDVIRAGTGTWWADRGAMTGSMAWIAPQFALHQSLPAHATAEGVIAGDFCKEAGDLGVPFVGVGLMYPRAYTHQRISADGWQEERVEYIDWSDAPIGPALRADGTLCHVAVEMGGATVYAAVWQVRAGRARVYLLDTEVPPNAPWDRELSGRHSIHDPDAALRQAVLLGAGAVSALEQLGIAPAGWRLAGGYATPVVLERLNRLVASGQSFDEALAAVRASTVFSARSDAPAPEVAFSFAAVERYLASTWPALAEHRAAVLALGRHPTDRGDTFNGCVLGARVGAVIHVSDAADHGHEAWTSLNADAPATQDTVQNTSEGVHLSSWISADLTRVFDQWLGERWREAQDEEETWAPLAGVPDEAFWDVRQRLRGYLVDFMRERARRRWARDQASGSRLVALGTLLDATALTIGCVPRFTSSAQLDLLFHDVERLARIASAARTPVQFVFAGCADAGDDSAKHHLQRVFRQTLDPVFGGRLAFLEDYDLHVARLMVQGCDVWLSVPPYTGGPSLGAVKAAVNGVPHIGPPSAWFAAALTGGNGWIVDAGRGRDDGAQARALYSLIEERIVPEFYARDRNNVPAGWAGIIRQTIMAALPRFSARRAVKAWSAGGPVLGSVSNYVRP